MIKICYHYSMIIHASKNHYIFNPQISDMDYNAVRAIEGFILSNQLDKPLAIDLQQVKTCCRELFELLNKSKRKLFLINVPSEIYTMINLLEYDKNTGVFVSELDLEENKRELKNRKFAIV